MTNTQPRKSYPRYEGQAFTQDLPPCDLVMRGGIADGVAYPAAVVELATQYRFARIGGTSAGAFAAAGVAAAELGRQQIMQQAADEAPALAATEQGDPEYYHFLGLQYMNDELLGIPGQSSLILRLFANSTTHVSRPIFRIALDIINLLKRSSPIAHTPDSDQARTIWQTIQGLGRTLTGVLMLMFRFVWSLLRLAFSLLRNNPLWFLGSALILWFALPDDSLIFTQFQFQGRDQTAAPQPMLDLFNTILATLESRAGVLIVCFLFGAFVSFLQIIWRTLTALPEAPHFFGICTGMHQPDDYTRFYTWLARLIGGVHSGWSQQLAKRAQEHHTQRTANSPGLTEWMTWWFNRLAARRQDTDPVTFADLSKFEIGLQMVTTNLSEHRPYVLPFSKNDPRRFIFHAQEWGALFPPNVVEYLIRIAKTDREQGIARFALPKGFYYLPEDPEQLPIVVAARMSLSLPLVISAIPLYTLAESVRAASTRIDAKTPLPVHLLRRHLFSDGGATSNFPIHFFDKWLPDRPTFGMRTYNTTNPEADIELRRADDRREPVYSNITAMFGFLFSMIDTMMNYRDALQSELPSYQERIVAIPLTEEEGGLNLDMDTRTIENIQKKGHDAARKLLLYGSPGEERFNFEHHWWVRFRLLMWELEEQLLSLERELRVDRVSPRTEPGEQLPLKRSDSRSQVTDVHRQRVEALMASLELGENRTTNPLEDILRNKRRSGRESSALFFADDYVRRLAQVRLDLRQNQRFYPFVSADEDQLLDDSWFDGAEMRIEILLTLIDLWSLPPDDIKHAQQVARIVRELVPELRTPASQRTGSLLYQGQRRQRRTHFFSVNGIDPEEATLRVTPRL